MSSNLKQFGNCLDSGVDRVRQLSKDFCEKLNVTLFGYVRVYHDGRVGWVTSNADHDRLLIESGSMDLDPLIDNAQALKQGQYLWFHDRKFPDCESFYRDRVSRFHVDHGMILVKHQKDYLETACFSGSLAKQPLYNVFMNEGGLFNAFMEHFKKQLNRPLLHLIEDGLLISDIKETFGKQTLDQVSHDLRLSLLASCGWAKLLKFSPREKECLMLLRQGFSYQKIGEALGLSERTVEHYLESVKNKLEVQSRSELIWVADKLMQLGIAHP